MNKVIKNFAGVAIGLLCVGISVLIVMALITPSEPPVGSPLLTFSDATNSSKVVTATSTQIFAANTGRLFASISNGSATDSLFLSLGATAVASKGIELSPGESYQFDSTNLYVGAVNGYALATVNVAIVEK